MRAVAVIAVVAYHAGLSFPGGFVGVDVFFVISGYVIASALRREWLSTGTIDLRGFFARRARRLLPAFTAMIAVVVTAGAVLAPQAGQRILYSTGAAASLFNANSYLMLQEDGYFERATELNALLHTWSLSVEEQFYIGFPLFMLVLWRVGTRWFDGRTDVAVFSGVALAALASLAGALWLFSSVDDGERWAFYLAPARAWEFLAGVLVALVAPRLRSVAAAFAAPLALVGWSLVGYALFAYDVATPFPGVAALVPVLGTMLLIAAGDVSPAAPPVRLLGVRPLVAVGDLSYGWYLWHWPALVFAAAWWPNSQVMPPLAAVASIGLAAVSYAFLEQPVRRSRRWTLGGTAALALGCIVIGVGASVAQVAAVRAADEPESVAGLASHAADERGCDDGRSLSELPDDCSWGPANGPRIVVVGDSQAIALSTGVIAAAGDDTQVTVAGLNGCPFVDLHTDPDPVVRERCHTFHDDLLLELVADAPDMVIVSSSADLWLRTPDPFDGRDGAGSFADNDRPAAWQGALDRMVAPLVDAGIDVVLAHGSPVLDEWDPRACAHRLLAEAPERCGFDESSDELLARRSPGFTAELAVADRYSLATLDAASAVCDTRCVAWDGEWTMRDRAHLSRAGSLRLVGDITALLDGVDRGVLRAVESED